MSGLGQANSAKIAEIRARAEDWLAGRTRWAAASPEYVSQQSLDVLALVEIAEAARVLADCGVHPGPELARLEQALSKVSFDA